MKKLTILMLMIVGIVTSAFAQSSAKSGMIVTNDGETIKAYNLDFSSQDYCYYTLSEDSDDLKRIKKSDVLIIKTEDGKKIDPSSGVATYKASTQKNASVDDEEEDDDTGIILPGSTKKSTKKVTASNGSVKNPDAHEPVTHYVKRAPFEKKRNVYYVSEDAHGGNLLNMMILNEDKLTMAVAPEGDNLEYEDAYYIIPDYVELNGKTYTVEEIGESAFGYRWSNKDIREIVLPNTLKKIRNKGFLGCVKLRRIVLPESIESVGTQAFTACGSSADSFEGIYIPKTLENIGAYSFLNCGKKTSYRGYYQGYLMSLPDWINEGNCLELGIDEEAVQAYRQRNR